MKKQIINPWKWQDEIGFVQALKVKNPQDWLICAGQTAVNAEGVPQHVGDMHGQIHFALSNLETILASANMELKDVVRLSYYTTDIIAFHKANDSLKDRLKDAGCFPTATLLEVSSLAFPELLVEMEATAVI